MDMSCVQLIEAKRGEKLYKNRAKVSAIKGTSSAVDARKCAIKGTSSAVDARKCAIKGMGFDYAQPPSATKGTGSLYIKLCQSK